jgi:hypothetical protein
MTTGRRCGDCSRRRPAGLHSRAVGAWYTIGLCLGVGVGAGVLAAGLFARGIPGIVVAAVGGAATGALVGLLVGGSAQVVAGVVGGVLGAIGAAQVVVGALRRGGTKGGVAFLVAGAGIVVALLALVPVVGYAAAVAVPALGARLRRRFPERYAGLRTLAK